MHKPRESKVCTELGAGLDTTTCDAIRLNAANNALMYLSARLTMQGSTRKLF